MFEPFLNMVRLYVLNVSEPSIIVTVLPIDGEGGRVIVNAPPDVSAIILSLAPAVYVVDLVVHDSPVTKPTLTSVSENAGNDKTTTINSA